MMQVVVEDGSEGEDESLGTAGASFSMPALVDGPSQARRDVEAIDEEVQAEARARAAAQARLDVTVSAELQREHELEQHENRSTRDEALSITEPLVVAPPSLGSSKDGYIGPEQGAARSNRIDISCQTDGLFDVQPRLFERDTGEFVSTRHFLLEPSTSFL